MGEDTLDGCPFCDYAGPNEILADYGDTFIIEPLNPVVTGHVLAVPREHVTDAFEAPTVTGRTARLAIRYARENDIRAANIITSVVWQATQTIPHLHIHIVPRTEHDGLALPWTPPDCTWGCTERLSELGGTIVP